MVTTSRSSLMQWLRFQVAGFAVWFCGIPTLYWEAPKEWEEYMGQGEPYQEEWQPIELDSDMKESFKPILVSYYAKYNNQPASPITVCRRVARETGKRDN